jgi:hypothetical protein
MLWSTRVLETCDRVSAVADTTTQRLTNATGSRVPQDFQRIITDFAGGAAFV